MDYSLRPLVEVIRAQAEDARAGDDALLRLAAHLFAIGEQLLARRRDARFSRPSRALGSKPLVLLLDHLAALSLETDSTTLYDVVTVALQTIDGELSGKHHAAVSLRTRFPISQVEVGGEMVLGGEVLCWRRPRSRLAELRRRRERDADDAGKRRPPDRAPHPSDCLQTVGMYWLDSRHPRVEPKDLGERTLPLVHDSGSDAAVRQCFRIALCPLAGPFRPFFAIAGGFFTACRHAPMIEREALHEHLHAILEAAQRQQIHLVVLPELTIDPEARELIAGWLKKRRSTEAPYGVVAGSFHVWPDEEATSPPFNESPLLDHAGGILLLHRKRGWYRITPADVVHLPGSFENGEQHAANRGSLPLEIPEGIRHGSTLRVLDTSLGRLAILICADAIEADEHGYMPVVKRMRPDLLFVVSMSRETERFDATSQVLARHGIGTVFVNAACVCNQKRKATLLSCDLALFQPEGWAQTWLRWQAGDEEVELYDRYPSRKDGRGQDKGWRKLDRTVQDHPGIRWLTSGPERGKSLGVVLDLGVFWGEKGPEP
jgi:predicted amidohydrolase